MEKCQSFKKFARTLHGRLSPGGWFIVSVVLIAHLVPSSQGCLRALGRVARRPIRSGVEVIEDAAQVPRQTMSLPRNMKVDPLDRDPSDAIHIISADAQRRTSSLGGFLPKLEPGQAIRSET